MCGECTCVLYSALFTVRWVAQCPQNRNQREEIGADFEVNLNVHFSDTADCSVYSALQRTFNSKMSSEVSLACSVAVFVCSIDSFVCVYLSAVYM